MDAHKWAKPTLIAILLAALSLLAVQRFIKVNANTSSLAKTQEYRLGDTFPFTYYTSSTDRTTLDLSVVDAFFIDGLAEVMHKDPETSSLIEEGSLFVGVLFSSSDTTSVDPALVSTNLVLESGVSVWSPNPAVLWACKDELAAWESDDTFCIVFELPQSTIPNDIKGAPDTAAFTLVTPEGKERAKIDLGTLRTQSLPSLGGA